MSKTSTVLPAIVILFFNPVVSFFIYGAMVLIIIFASVLGKIEMVTIWPVTRKSGGGEPTRPH
ncbi:MAG: hypothetical protein GTO17_06730 [Candidatus Aminicenantes bacterium]|nr:hypothetical protein [Candidatus Aminicenantes bacterium]